MQQTCEQPGPVESDGTVHRGRTDITQQNIESLARQSLQRLNTIAAQRDLQSILQTVTDTATRIAARKSERSSTTS
jgi:hypothetical protein